MVTLGCSDRNGLDRIRVRALNFRIFLFELSQWIEWFWWYKFHGKYVYFYRRDRLRFEHERSFPAKDQFVFRMLRDKSLSRKI